MYKKKEKKKKSEVKHKFRVCKYILLSRNVNNNIRDFCREKKKENTLKYT